MHRCCLIEFILVEMAQVIADSRQAGIVAQQFKDVVFIRQGMLQDMEDTIVSPQIWCRHKNIVYPAILHHQVLHVKHQHLSGFGSR